MVYATERHSCHHRGVILTVLTIAIIPVAIVMVFKSAKDISDGDGDEADVKATVTTNPMTNEPED